jgi:hypothetical protein
MGRDSRLPNRALMVVGLILVVAGFLFIGAAEGIAIKGLSFVNFTAPEGFQVNIAGISMAVAAALWSGVVLIILGIFAIYLSGRHSISLT